MSGYARRARAKQEEKKWVFAASHPLAWDPFLRAALRSPGIQRSSGARRSAVSRQECVRARGMPAVTVLYFAAAREATGCRCSQVASNQFDILARSLDV